MQPIRECITFLATHQFIRNFSVESMIENNNDHFLKNNLIWYCVGTIENKRYVHCIQFLKKTPRPGITSYLIRWYNTAPFSNLPLDSIPQRFDYTEFWFHSGVALRKNFFIF